MPLGTWILLGAFVVGVWMLSRTEFGRTPVLILGKGEEDSPEVSELIDQLEELADQLERMGDRLTDLEERLDFTERSLAQRPRPALREGSLPEVSTDIETPV